MRGALSSVSSSKGNGNECIASFDRPTVLVTKTDLTYTVTLQTSCTLPSDNRQDAVVSQPLLRQPAAETERVGRVEIEMACRSWARTKAPPARIESSGIRGASSTQDSSTLFLCWPPLTRKSYLAASLGRYMYPLPFQQWRSAQPCSTSSPRSCRQPHRRR